MFQTKEKGEITVSRPNRQSSNAKFEIKAKIEMSECFDSSLGTEMIELRDFGLVVKNRSSIG